MLWLNILGSQTKGVFVAWILANYQAVLLILLALMQSVSLALHIAGKQKPAALDSAEKAIEGIPGVKNPGIDA